MTVTAGSLVWDLDIAKQDEALRKVDAIGRKLDEALNKPRSTPGGGKSPLTGVGEDADKAANRIAAFQQEFTRLTAQLRAGQSTASQYGSSLRTLQSNLLSTARATDLTNQEYSALNSLLPRVERAQATLGGTTAEVQAKTQALVGEIRRLRNDWQRTGEATTETKRRLQELSFETAEYAAELKNADGGTVRFGRQLDQLAVAGRSATATIDGMEGRMSRLGLASQVNLGVFGALQNQLGGLGPAGRIAGQGLGIVAGGFGEVGALSIGAASGIAAVGAAAGLLIKRGIPEVKEMQNALRVLVASGEDLTQAGFEETLRGIQEAAGRAGQQFRRAEIATALAEIVKAGVDAADAMHLLTPGMQLAAVTGQSLNETTTLLLGNLRQFGLATSEAARLADALAAADLAAAQGAKELSEGLAVVGPVAAAAGFELEDVLGILVELNNKGMDAASVGATALRATLTSLLDPTAKAKDTLASLGVEISDGTGRRRPLLTVLHELREALEGNEDAAFAAAEIFDTRAITAIINMSEESNTLADSLRNSNGALKEYADTMLRENLEAAQRGLNTAISDLALTFAGTFAGDIVRATEALAGWVRQVEAAAKAPDVWTLLGALDPRFRNFDSMDGGQQFRTILFGGTLSDRLVGAENPAEAIALINQEIESLQARLNSRWTLSGHQGIQDAIDRAYELLDVYTAIANIPDLGGPLGEPDPFAPRSRPAGWASDSGEGSTALGQSMSALIAEARVLKTALDEAVAAGNPEGWDAASQAVQAFRERGDEAARAWQAVMATLAGKGAQPARTVDDIFKDLEKAGTTAERAAAAVGNTLEADLRSLETRSNAVNAAINELMARPDVNEGNNPDRLAYLLNLSKELETSTARVKRQIATLAAGTGGIAGLPAGDMTIAGVTIPVTTDPAEAARRRAAIENWQKAQAAVEAYGTALADVETRLNLGLVNAEGAVNERLSATQQLLRAMVPLYSTLTEEQRAYVQGIIGDSKDLQRELEQLERDAATARAQHEHRARMQAEDDRPTITGVFKTPAELAAWVQEQRAAARELEDAVRLAATRRGVEILQGTRESAALRLEALALGREITTAIADGSLEGLQELEARLLTTLEGLGDDPSAAPFIGLLTQVRTGIRAVTAEVEQEARDLEARQRRNVTNVMRIELERQYRDLGQRSVAAMRAGSIDALRALEKEVLELLNKLGDDPSAAPLMGVLTGIRAEIQNLTTAADQSSLEGLQRRIIALRNLGAEPTSEAVKDLVRQINELQLKAALDELRTKGFKNLSDFARKVLELNGLLPSSTMEANKFSTALRSLGDGAATGLADVVDGIQKIAEAGGNAETIVEGLTQAINGARMLIDAFGSGDAFEAIRSMAMLFGEGLSMLPGMPAGLGALAGGIFDLGRSIVQAISDAFTGDSPAARAIREGLTPAVQSAFANGILLALQSGEDWHETLRENLKLAFLTSLINAFVQSAIIGPILQPIFTEYSKMVARGQWEAAGEFLASTLPGAIEDGITAAEHFMSYLPPSLLPTRPPGPKPPGGSGGDPLAGPTGVFELPTAAVTGIAAPEWARDLVNAGRMQLDAAAAFSAAVELLRTEGIHIRTDPGSPPPTGGNAAAARAV